MSDHSLDSGMSSLLHTVPNGLEAEPFLPVVSPKLVDKSYKGGDALSSENLPRNVRT